MLSLQTVKYLLYPDFNAILFSVIRTANMTSSGAGVDPTMLWHLRFIVLIFGNRQYKRLKYRSVFYIGI